MEEEIHRLKVGELYSNEEITNALGVSNTGGIRPMVRGNVVRRLVLTTSIGEFHAATENPYHDRLEGEILTYTAAGKFGQQTLSGVNGRLIDQKQLRFPIHGFVQIASRRDKSVGPRRWRYLGLLQYLRHYPDTQMGSDGKVRHVWLFEFRIHSEPQVVPVGLDAKLSDELLLTAQRSRQETGDDEVVINKSGLSPGNADEIERVRGRLFALEARRFEFFVKDLLTHCGFTEVCVTKSSGDGGVDVNGRAGPRLWLFTGALVQIQAKRWLHSVGRREVAELRGSLQPFARGAVLTTSHFSKAAIFEACESGKNPIALIDGFMLSRIVIDELFCL